MGVYFCSTTGPSSRPSLGRKMVRPGLVAAGEEGLEHGLAEILLSNDCKSHRRIAIFISGGFLGSLGRRREGAGLLEAADLVFFVLQDFLQDLLGMLAERRRAPDLRRRGGELDRHADVPTLAAV